MAKFRVGIIATGGIANAHARGWRANDGLTDIVAIADTNDAARDEFGARWGVAPEQRYADYRQMLDRERPDIVSVCSWHGRHAEMAIAAAARRPRAVLCEKPMALNLGEADQMIVAARRNGVLLAIGHMRRFYRGWEEARRLIADGAIGQPRRLWSQINEGILNWGTHTVDGMRFALGDPATEWVVGNVERRTDRHERGMRIEDAGVGVIGFAGGAQATLVSDVVPGGSINFEVVGTEGMIAADENDVRIFGPGGWRELDHEKNDPFGAQARGIVDWIEGRVEDFRGDARHARATLEILMAIYESARRHEVVRTPLKTRAAPLELMVEAGDLPVERPGPYDIRSSAVRGEAMSWTS